jgi:hypothetical protein
MSSCSPAIFDLVKRRTRIGRSCGQPPIKVYSRGVAVAMVLPPILCISRSCRNFVEDSHASRVAGSTPQRSIE